MSYVCVFLIYGMLYFITQVLVIVLRHGFDSVMFCSVRLCSPICYFIGSIILCYALVYYNIFPSTEKSLVKGFLVKGSLIHGNPLITETPCKGKSLTYTEKYLYMEISYKEIP